MYMYASYANILNTGHLVEDWCCLLVLPLITEDNASIYIDTYLNLLSVYHGHDIV